MTALRADFTCWLAAITELITMLRAHVTFMSDSQSRRYGEMSHFASPTITEPIALLRTDVTLMSHFESRCYGQMSHLASPTITEPIAVLRSHVTHSFTQRDTANHGATPHVTL